MIGATKTIKKSSLTKVAKGKSKKEKKDEFGINLEEMARAGVGFGHHTSKCYPRMKQYIFGARNTVHIIDLEKTSEKLKEALRFIQEFVSEGKILLLVGTKIQHRKTIKEIAKEHNLPYVSERWLGGTFSNFEVIRKRVEYFKELEKKQKEGGFEEYTKKEKIKLNRELEKLRMKFEGIKDMTRIPDAIFVVDIKKDGLAVKEAKMKGVKVIGIVDTNIDPFLADFPIPANDDAISSVKYILDKVSEVIKKTKIKKEK